MVEEGAASGSVRGGRVTARAHALVRARMRGCEGVIALDATVGNGHDTVFLAERAGASGTVIGFDVQEEALAKARARLEETRFGGRVELHCLGHERMGQVIRDSVTVAMFNLGYLPGGDKTVITEAGTTVKALTQAFGLLAEGGLITVVVYRGHAGGKEEAEAVKRFCASLNESAARVRIIGEGDSAGETPFLIAIEKRGPGAGAKLEM